MRVDYKKLVTQYITEQNYQAIVEVGRENNARGTALCADEHLGRLSQCAALVCCVGAGGTGWPLTRRITMKFIAM